MNASTTEVVKYLFKIISDAQVQAYQALWDGLILFLSSNWLSVTGILLFLLVVSFIKAINGRWGMFGSIAYNYLYWGILFVSGLIFGPKIFANTYVDIVYFLLYLLCYWLVGRFLRKLRFN
ncbi:MAG: hypothetical protein PHR00_03850 [Patescibacteria group bacterium]|nr:hypothetical protein [Patescibacteria group bacterium]